MTMAIRFMDEYRPRFVSVNDKTRHARTTDAIAGAVGKDTIDD